MRREDWINSVIISEPGTEFQVNEVTSGIVDFPLTASLASGRVVVVWRDDSGIGGDTSGRGVKARIFDPSGAPLGGEFLVNLNTFGNQSPIGVVALSGGGFAVGYADQSGGYPGKVRIFDSSGAPVGSEIVVFTGFNGMAMAAVGQGFIVTWGTNTSTDLRAQVFDGDGSALGASFTVTSTTAAGQYHSRYDLVATELSSGMLFMTWTDVDTETGLYLSQGRIFAPTGEAQGGAVLSQRCSRGANCRACFRKNSRTLG